jgi:hypothetical protein
MGKGNARKNEKRKLKGICDTNMKCRHTKKARKCGRKKTRKIPKEKTKLKGGKTSK